MNRTKIYKIAGILIKIGIIILAFAFIIREVFFKQDIKDISSFLFLVFSGKNISVFVGVALLMPVNWGLEIIKWKYLVSRLEKVSLWKSVIAVFSGVTVSTVTPNRVGEFGGRVFVLEHKNRWQGVVLTVAGGISQLLTTICIGLISILFFNEYLGLNSFFTIVLFISVIISFFLLLLFYFNISYLYVLINKVKRLRRFDRYMSVLKTLGKEVLGRLLVLSILRHIIFSFQFFLLLCMCGLPLNFVESFMLTSVFFFVMAAIPTIALSEFGVRGSVSVFVFSMYYGGMHPGDSLTLGVITAAFLLWIINVVVPAMIGGIFVFKLKFFKS